MLILHTPPPPLSPLPPPPSKPLSISFVDKLHSYLVHLEHTTSIPLLFEDEVSFQLELIGAQSPLFNTGQKLSYSSLDIVHELNVTTLINAMQTLLSFLRKIQFNHATYWPIQTYN